MTTQLAQIADLLEDNERNSTLEALRIIESAHQSQGLTPEVSQGFMAVARSLYETSESHEEGVDALRFALTHCGPNAAAELMEDFDGADAVQRIHLVLIAEEDGNEWAALYRALPSRSRIKRRLRAAWASKR